MKFEVFTNADSAGQQYPRVIVAPQVGCTAKTDGLPEDPGAGVAVLAQPRAPRVPPILQLHAIRFGRGDLITRRASRARRHAAELAAWEANGGDYLLSNQLQTVGA